MNNNEKSKEYIKDLSLILKSLEKENGRYILFLKCKKNGLDTYLTMDSLHPKELFEVFNVFMKNVKYELKNEHNNCVCSECKEAIKKLQTILRTYESMSWTNEKGEK